MNVESSLVCMDDETQLGYDDPCFSPKKKRVKDDEKALSASFSRHTTGSSKRSPLSASLEVTSYAPLRSKKPSPPAKEASSYGEKRSESVKTDRTRQMPSAAYNNEDTSQGFAHEHQDTSQALFSQIAETPQLHPPRATIPKSASTASKERKNVKDASVVKSVQRWTSNVVARDFVGSTTNPPAKKKQQANNEVRPDAVLSENAVTAVAPVSKSARSSMKPPRNPYAYKKSPGAAKASARIDWSDEDDSPRPYKYQEVVRCRHDRQNLPGHECPDCKPFLDAVCNAEGGDVFDRNKIVDCSRHRSAHSPPSTPEGFWDLSFADEKQARENK
jgi:hypothetical protein